MSNLSPALKVLIVDDDINICKTLNMTLKRMNCAVVEAYSVEEAIEKLRQDSFDLILTDFRFESDTGSSLIKKAKALGVESLIAVMTAFASFENALEVTKEGAFDYIPKPFNQAQLQSLLKRVRLIIALRDENEKLRSIDESSRFFSGFTSAASLRLQAFVAKVAASDETILLVGESGTGKSLLAHLIHRISNRSNEPFITINCTSLAEGALDSDTFDRGTLFLDEVCDLSLAAQAKLLRFLEERVISRVGSRDSFTCDVRVIATASRDLDEAVAAGQFRQDLYTRLNIFECNLVPLRFRKEDLPVFIQKFVEEFSLSMGRDLTPLLPEALMQRLVSYSWPGNVRELRNVMERLVYLSSGGDLKVDDLPERLIASAGQGATMLKLADVERAHIEKVIEMERNMEKAAELLGINKVTLWRKRREYGLP